MKIHFVSVLVILVMLFGGFVIPTVPTDIRPQVTPAADSEVLSEALDGLFDDEIQALESQHTDPGIDQSVDIGLVLQDMENTYTEVFEPWKSKAAIHALSYHDESGFLALAGGYLYDNSIHIYRLNQVTKTFDKVWTIGSEVIQMDIVGLSWGDTDLNDFLEIAAASTDGHVYLFEQRHIYDPYTSTENMFDLVWTSPSSLRAYDVEIADTDHDYRDDIIIAGWDGKVRNYEYSNHSGYPFTEDHWIEFEEVWNSGESITGLPTTLATGDTNNNGLPEIIVGTREGVVYVFENDGLTIMINGEPFPLIHDNHYTLNWTSGTYTWTPIISMETGELDDEDGDEIALVAQGQGVYILDWDAIEKDFKYRRVFREWEEWQTNPISPWRLDSYADRVVSASNVTYLLANGTHIPEPITYTYLGGGVFDPDAECYPYNTGMASAVDNHYTTFDAASVPAAEAVVDFGMDEEGTGSGNQNHDVEMKFESSITSALLSEVNISISQMGDSFEQVLPSEISWSGPILRLRLDPALGRRQWDWYRYMKITVYNGGNYNIDTIWLAQVKTQLSTALSVEIGPLPTEVQLTTDVDLSNKVMVGIADGNILAFEDDGDLVWDSGRDEFFTVGENIWDMEHITIESRLPIWAYWGASMVFNDLAGRGYIHHTIGDLDPFDQTGYEQPYNLITSDDTGDLRAYSWFGEEFIYDTMLSLVLTPIEIWNLGWERSIELVDLSTLTAYPWAAVGALNPTMTGEVYGFIPYEYNAVLHFWVRPSGPDDYIGHIGVEELDATGDIDLALKYAKTVPRTKFVDWDDDGDMDMLLSTGYLYYCENVGNETVPTFHLHPGFFEEMNTRPMNYYWGQPETWDIDQDGDNDMILSFDGRRGATYYENQGTQESPIWVENKKMFSNTNPATNMKFIGLSDIRIVPMSWGTPARYYNFYAEDQGFDAVYDADYTMWAYHPDAHVIWMSWPSYTQTESYLMATYPTVYQYEIAPSEVTGTFNLGYHVMETWSTEDDLADWTLTVRSGDVDGDGNGELIVGDYDNNVYIFEHLVNNTYKRSFKSHNLNHTEESDTSPYLWEELEGISGDFQRVIWDHAEHILADCDIDNDGYLELVIAAGLQVYIFEHTGIDDTYALVYSVDLRDSFYNGEPEWDSVDSITAITAGPDFNLNDENELVIAAGPFLFVYDIGQDAWGKITEYFMDDRIEGKYYLVGNGVQDDLTIARIAAMTVADSDEDGHPELILGGRINVTQIRQDGFLKVYEWLGAGFGEVWDAPSELTMWNPVTSVIIDDQDYDSRQEIIVGHTHGFDIWEWDGMDSSYTKIEVVTSSPNYPIVHLDTTRLQDPWEEYNLTQRGNSDIEYVYSVVNNLIAMVFCQSDRLYWKRYLVSSDMWIENAEMAINTTSGFNSYPAPYDGYQLVFEVEPSLFLSDNNTLYLTWITLFYSGSYHYTIWISRFTDNGPGLNWDQPVPVRTRPEFSLRYPKAFKLNATHIGVAYWYAISDKLAYRTSDSWGTWSLSTQMAFTGYDDYHVQNYDLIGLSDGRYALAISAMNKTISKFDFDIYVGISNSSFVWDNVSMHAATSSYRDEVNPCLAQLDAPEDSLMVIYESPEAPFEDSIQVSYSANSRLWIEETPMHTVPDYVIRSETPDGVKFYFDSPSEGMSLLKNVVAMSPSILALRGGGFMHSFTFDFFMAARDYTFKPSQINQGNYDEGADVVYGINPSSRFTHHTIGEVVDLAVGDTDGDARREILAAFENRVGLYELNHSNVGGGISEHEDAWMSMEYDYPVTGVTVNVINSNGWQDIGISCEHGDVFVYETTASGSDAVDFMFSVDMWTNGTVGSTVDMGYGHSMALIVEDLDDDGRDEIVRGETTGVIRAFDDDGSELWSNSDRSGSAFMMTYVNMTATQHYIAIFRTDGMVSLIDADTGSEHFSHDTLVGFHGTITSGDVQGTASKEIVAFANGATPTLFVFAWGGSVIWQRQTSGSGTMGMVTVGNFTGGSKLDIAVSYLNGTVGIYSGTNGSLLISVETLGSPVTIPAVVDLTGDGIDELITAHLSLRIYNPATDTIIYNSSSLIPDYSRWFFYEDFDDDSINEAILVTGEGVYYEEITSQRHLWSYAPETSGIDDAMLMTLPSGRLGIALCTDDGYIIALDGSTGIPVWFDDSLRTYNQLGAGDFDGDLVSEIAGSTNDGHLYYIQDLAPNDVPYFDAFDYWTIYSSTTSRTTVEAMGAYDVDSDGVSEYFIHAGNEVLTMYDPVTQTAEWSTSIPGEILYIAFGDLQGDTTEDIIIVRSYDTNRIVTALDGATGSVLSGIDQSGSDMERIIGVDIDNYNTAITGNEYVLFWEHASGVCAWRMYDNSGSLRFGNSVNTTTVMTSYATGWFDGDTRLDIAMGCEDGNLYVYGGLGGLLSTVGYSGFDVADVATGDIDGIGNQDIAVAYEDGNIATFDENINPLGSTNRNVHIDDIFVLDVEPASGDEIVVNSREAGVVVLDSSSLDELWLYEIYTVYEKDIAFVDVDKSGDLDMILFYLDHCVLVDVSEKSVLGAVALGFDVEYITYGNFDDDGLIDIGYFQDYSYYIVTDGSVPPPFIQSTGQESLNQLAAIMVVSVLSSIPLIPLGIVVIVHWRKKEDET